MFLAELLFFLKPQFYIYKKKTSRLNVKNEDVKKYFHELNLRRESAKRALLLGRSCTRRAV